MLPCFHEMKGKEYDCLTFLPADDDNLNIELGMLVDPGEKIGGSKMGDSYNIILFKEGEEGVTDIDNFKAILGCPFEYASFLIPGGWYGMITKDTTTSHEMCEDMLENLKSYA